MDSKRAFLCTPLRDNPPDLESSREQNRSRFTLQASADDALTYFLGGDSVSAKALFASWRSLRTLIEKQRRLR